MSKKKVHNFKSPCGTYMESGHLVAAEKKNITCKRCLAKLKKEKSK